VNSIDINGPLTILLAMHQRKKSSEKLKGLKTFESCWNLWIFEGSNLRCITNLYTNSDWATSCECQHDKHHIISVYIYTLVRQQLPAATQHDMNTTLFTTVVDKLFRPRAAWNILVGHIQQKN